MRLSTGWSAHFSAFGGSDTANVNMAMFSDAMDADKSKMEKINSLIKEEDTLALVKGKNGKIYTLYGFKKFGRTQLCPELKIGCLIGSGVHANPIIVDLDQITSAKEVTLPTIWKCTTIDELKYLENQAHQPLQQLRL
jgi:hypothetical protein